MTDEKQQITIRGARVHNLKNISLTIPHNKLVVVTGLSGSGKSTLAFDTIFAEGQRRYVESLSAYARQFLGRIEKPDVDMISGIAPAIAIEQKVSTKNPRSTVGTTTEIYDYLKLLFARIGHTFSPISGREVVCYQPEQVVNEAIEHWSGSRVMVAAPLVLTEGQSIIEQLTVLFGEGILRIYRDGQTSLIEDVIKDISNDEKVDDISVVVDRARLSDDEEQGSRLRDAVARAYELGGGVCRIIVLGDEQNEVIEYSSRLELDGMTFEEPTEHLFSFNNPIGACPRCEGYGKVVGIDEDLVVPDKSRSIFEDAIACWKGQTMKWWKEQLVNNAYKFDFPIHKPYHDLTREQKQLLWRGNEFFHGLDEFFQYIDSERYKIQFRVMKARYTGKTLCSECGGSRLRQEALYVRVGDRTIADLVTMTVDELVDFFATIELNDYDKATSERIMVEIRNRLRYLTDVGLGYLTLDRLSSTLSGGESQRINLSTSLGSSLVGSLYILDEPSIGLHPRDTHRLIGVLKQLRDLGNTVIVVEHEEEVIRAADYIVDIGPRAGELGGRVVFNGPLDKLLNEPSESLTADYLTGRRSIAAPQSFRSPSGHITIRGARENNLKGIDVKIPLGVMTCITGVSGSGKSSFVNGILYPALRRQLTETGLKPGDFESLEGDLSLLSSVELVDQNPIGKSSRSNPVTYIKAYDEIRRLYADQPYAKHNAMGPSHFSFNIAGGRCEECQGDGVIKVSMQFMADIELKCEACGGRRFKDDVLEARWHEKSIYDVLEMTIDEAIEFFGAGTESTCRRIVERLQPLQDVGLGYIKLGQSSSTLSGGESQRVKLASYMLRENSAGRVMFIFDEPTTGLHFHDINKLLAAFAALIERGHSVVIVEHNMDVIKCADWVIDLGPEAGDRGGEIVFEGTPRDLQQCERSYTGQFLAKH